MHCYLYFEIIRQVLTSPKPKLAFAKTLISLFTIFVGKLFAVIKSIISGLGSSMLILGCTNRCSICKTAATVSIEPAALRQCPIIDFNEFTNGKSAPFLFNASAQF